MNAFNFKEMFLLGWPILSILILCSVLSIAIILERWVFLKKRNIDVKDFLNKIPKVLAGGKDSPQIAATLGEPMISITRAALGSSGSKNSLELTLDRAIRMEISDMEKFVPILGTVAGAAPFIGLLGTVIGIIRAFKSISISGGGGPQIVAGGISEALVATALGLMVAIPALVFYNYFSTKIRRLTESMEICADELAEILSKK